MPPIVGDGDDGLCEKIRKLNEYILKWVPRPMATTARTSRSPLGNVEILTTSTTKLCKCSAVITAICAQLVYCNYSMYVHYYGTLWCYNEVGTRINEGFECRRRGGRNDEAGTT
jgi:hypothetical protein